MRIKMFNSPQNRLKTLKRFSRYQKIRKINKFSNKLVSLRFNSRRLWQVWRWRFNRKSYQTWKPARYIKPNSLSSSVKLRHQTTFRLHRTLQKYIQWRFNNRYINLSRVKQQFLAQNYLQNYNQVNAWLNSHIGILGVKFYQLRHITKWNRNLIRINNVLLKNQLATKNDILLFPKNVKTVINNKLLAFETNNLINGLMQYSLNNSAQMAKYYPKQQRHLNTNLL